MSNRLTIYRNEFDTYAQALAASEEFKYCGTCKSGVKLHEVRGRWLLLCARRPAAHVGVTRTWKE